MENRVYECLDCGVVLDGCDEAMRHYDQTHHAIANTAKSAKHNAAKPESDGQAEQHLGADRCIGETWYDEFTTFSEEDRKKFQEYFDQHPNKVKCAKWALGNWAKDQPTNKYDNGKPRLDLVPPAIIEAVGEVRTYGIKKYGDSESWKTVEPERYRAAMMRHLCAYLRDPESIDEESGINHLHHAACNIAFLLEMEKTKKEEGVKTK